MATILVLFEVANFKAFVQTLRKSQAFRTLRDLIFENNTQDAFLNSWRSPRHHIFTIPRYLSKNLGAEFFRVVF